MTKTLNVFQETDADIYKRLAIAAIQRMKFTRNEATGFSMATGDYTADDCDIAETWVASHCPNGHRKASLLAQIANARFLLGKKAAVLSEIRQKKENRARVLERNP